MSGEGETKREGLGGLCRGWPGEWDKIEKDLVGAGPGSPWQVFSTLFYFALF